MWYRKKPRRRHRLRRETAVSELNFCVQEITNIDDEVIHKTKCGTAIRQRFVHSSILYTVCESDIDRARYMHDAGELPASDGRKV